MGYSTSIKTLEKRMHLLDKIRQGQGDRWILAEGVRPAAFAYEIREALQIGHLYNELYPEFKNAPERFRVEIVDKRTVQAIPRPEGNTVVGRAEPEVRIQGLVHGEKAPPELMGPQTAASIIQAWHNMQPSNTPMFFPQARLNAEELEKLYKWGMERTPHWFIFVGVDGQLTLRPRQGNDDGLNWEPGDEA